MFGSAEREKTLKCAEDKGIINKIVHRGLCIEHGGRMREKNI